MKKNILLLSAATLMAALSTTSCGNKDAGEKGTAMSDTIKAVADTVKAEAKVAEAILARDFKYYEGVVKMITLDGIVLTANNTYSDTASKAFTIGYNITNAKEAGADKINFMAGSVQRLGNKEDVVNKTLKDFETVQTRQAAKGVKVGDFKEYKKNNIAVYYCTMKGVSDQMGGNKNYNMIFARMIDGDVYLDFTVTVLDKKADMARAENIIIMMANYLAK